MTNVLKKIIGMGVDLCTYLHVYLQLKQYSYIHFIHQEKFTKPFVDFLNSHFDSNRHMVICRKDESGMRFPMPSGPNVFSVNYFPSGVTWRLLVSKFSDRGIKQIIVHSLFYSELTQDLFLNQRLLKEKVYWMIWGGDLYNAKRDKVNDTVRAGFAGIITDTDGDEKVYEERYGKPRCVFNAGYTFPITWEMIANVRHEVKDYIRIQINNSCDRSTLEVLQWLSVYKNEPIRVRVIHSYGDMVFAKDIENVGKKFFGDKFEVIRDFMSPNKYAQHMAQNDILVLNQNRQQGLGNCFAALALGVKLFIRSEISTFTHLVTKGCVVHDTKMIPCMSFNNFVLIANQEQFNNREAAAPFFRGDYLQRLWEKVFVR